MVVKDVLLSRVDNFPSAGMEKFPEFSPLSRNRLFPVVCVGEDLDRARFIFLVVNTAGGVSGVR